MSFKLDFILQPSCKITSPVRGFVEFIDGDGVIFNRFFIDDHHVKGNNHILVTGNIEFKNDAKYKIIFSIDCEIKGDTSNPISENYRHFIYTNYDQNDLRMDASFNGSYNGETLSGEINI